MPCRTTSLPPRIPTLIPRRRPKHLQQRDLCWMPAVVVVVVRKNVRCVLAWILRVIMLSVIVVPFALWLDKIHSVALCAMCVCGCFVRRQAIKGLQNVRMTRICWAKSLSNPNLYNKSLAQKSVCLGEPGSCALRLRCQSFVFTLAWNEAMFVWNTFLANHCGEQWLQSKGGEKVRRKDTF